MNAKRVSRGNYIVNERYTITRVQRLGGLYDSGCAWRWQDSHNLSVGGEWRDSKRDALLDLEAFLGQQETR